VSPSNVRIDRYISGLLSRNIPQVILLQELLETPYFCQIEDPSFFSYATELEENKAVQHFVKISKELQLVLPICFFERKNNAHFNSVAMIDNGQIIGVYRKTHIPDGPGYEEKFYFNPGNTGFRVFNTSQCKIGIGICWDQWFPECARCLALQGAEMILYPTAIGSEPQNPSIDSKNHWQACMLGHAAANLVPVIASNRIGSETIEDSQIQFYGSSFISDPFGNKIKEASRDSEEILVATFNLDEIKKSRTSWGIFRDRRPEMYRSILTLDGDTSHMPPL